jgi:hypothetical protein
VFAILVPCGVAKIAHLRQGIAVKMRRGCMQRSLIEYIAQREKEKKRCFAFVFLLFSLFSGRGISFRIYHMEKARKNTSLRGKGEKRMLRICISSFSLYASGEVKAEIIAPHGGTEKT